MTEVVGIVQRMTGGPPEGRVLAVLRRNGDLVEVPRADIIRMKIVPTGGGAPVRIPESWGTADP
jgi:hypothetical protein